MGRGRGKDLVDRTRAMHEPLADILGGLLRQSRPGRQTTHRKPGHVVDAKDRVGLDGREEEDLGRDAKAVRAEEIEGREVGRDKRGRVAERSLRWLWRRRERD